MVYWYSGLQALSVTVFHTSVDLLCKKSYKSSSLLRYFNCFLSNHTVECCNINFSCLSQIRKEKIALQAMSLYFCCTFCVTGVVSMLLLANFSPCDPVIFCFSLTLYIHSLLKNNFFLMFMGNYWERNREREKFRLDRFPIVEAKSYFLHCSAL